MRSNIREGSSVIQVNNLEKAYDRKRVLCGLTLKVDKGEVCALTGLPGAGKTTALDIISGAMQPDGGRVEIDGADIDVSASTAKQNIGYVPSKPPVYQDMTPRAYLKFLADARGFMPREAGEKIDKALNVLELQDVADKPVKRLSRGVQRLVSMAQAIFFEPGALLIDEPTDELDAKEILTLRAAIAQIKKDRAVLLASSNLTEMMALADRVLVMKDGRIVAESTPSQLQNMTVMTDVMRVVTRSSREELNAALAGDKGLTLESAEDGADGLCAMIRMDGDRREALFKALSALRVLEMTAARQTGEELLGHLTSERIEGGNA